MQLAETQGADGAVAGDGGDGRVGGEGLAVVAGNHGVFVAAALGVAVHEGVGGCGGAVTGVLVLRINGADGHEDAAARALHLNDEGVDALVVGVGPAHGDVAGGIAERGGEVGDRSALQGLVVGNLLERSVVAQAARVFGVILAEDGDDAVEVDLGAVGLAVPDGVALDVFAGIELVEDGLRAVVHTLLVGQGVAVAAVGSGGEDAVVVPAGTPGPLGDHDGAATVLVIVVGEVAEGACGPVAVEVEQVAAPAALVDGLDEVLQVAPAAVMGALGAKTQARAHEVLPVGEHLLNGLRMVVGGVARLVVGLHDAGAAAAAAGGGRGPVLIDVVGHPFDVGQQALVALSPVVAPAGIQRRIGFCSAVGGQTALVHVPPLEDAVGRNLAVEHVGQGGNLEILLVGDEAARIAPAALADGKGHHVAALELEGADLVVEAGGGERLHVAAAVALGVVAVALALEVGLRVARQRLVAVCAAEVGVGEDNRAPVVHAYLATRCGGRAAVDLYLLIQLSGNHRRGLDVLDDDDGVIRVDDVDETVARERGGGGDDIVHVVRQCDFGGHLLHPGHRVSGECEDAARQHQTQEDEFFHSIAVCCVCVITCCRTP